MSSTERGGKRNKESINEIGISIATHRENGQQQQVSEVNPLLCIYTQTFWVIIVFHLLV